MSRFARFLCALLGALMLASPMLPAPGRAAETDQNTVALHGMLKEQQGWQSYKSRFVTESGRVVDTANGRISHSEGQGYGMLLAVAADDRNAFEAIWGWTRANLFVRGDELAAWRWEPGKRPAVADTNNASDGDILIAWALTEAGEAWGEASYKIAARRIAVEIGRKLILFKTSNGSLLLPGMTGFSADDRPDGPVLNLSYYVFPAFQRLALAAPEFDWIALGRAGMRLIDKARFGPAQLPSDWITLKNGEPQPAEGFPAHFSYNAIRIPLYMAWAGFDQPRHHAAFLTAWEGKGRGGLPLVDTAQGQPTVWLEEKGYAALPALSACASRGTPLPRAVRTPSSNDHYYPATLNLLVLTAARMRYPSCMQD